MILLPERRTLIAVLAILCGVVAVSVVAAGLPLPEGLLGPASGRLATRFVDARGLVLRETLDSEEHRSGWTRLEDVGAPVILASLASEDHQFLAHRGVDLVGLARASWLNATHQAIVSGASTITMQLARMTFDLPRNGAGKVKQALVALWLEERMDKELILEAYLNRASFGRNIVGIGEAARIYFSKTPARLTLGEASALAAIPRAPTLYDPHNGTDALEARRKHILSLMEKRGWIDADTRRHAEEEILALQPLRTPFLAPHFVEAARAEMRRADISAGIDTVRTTLDPDAQSAAEASCRAVVRRLGDRRVTNCAVIALRVSTAEVLAMVGSAAFFDRPTGGQVNGALSLRQPGSALKPFVYGLAFEHGVTPATLIADVETRFATPQGDFVPRNYDNRFHGPVRAREALANSFNVPAVILARELGPDAVLARLRELGFRSLDKDAEHYGVAIALGDGEVRLLDLAAAYATLARGGVYTSPTLISSIEGVDAHGRRQRSSLPPPESRRVMPHEVAYLLTDVLSDPHARVAAFGEASALELPFPAAAKTGTSKNYRDNWAIGYAGDVVVAAWVGNFDAAPMQGVSGVTGAAPVFRSVLTSILGPNAPRVARTAPRGIEGARICPLSGELAGHHCPHSMREQFLSGSAPTRTCSMHTEHGLEVPPELRAWASHSGWPTADAPLVQPST